MEKGEKTEMMLDLGPKESVETHQKDGRGGSKALDAEGINAKACNLK